MGDSITLFTGENCDYSARVTRILENEVEVRILEVKEVYHKLWRTILAQAIPKSQKMDWIVEKATELGVDEIWPLLTSRVVKKSSGIERWQRIAESAAMQSGRGIVPIVHPVISWNEFLEVSKNFSSLLIATVQGKDRLRLDQAAQNIGTNDSIALAIGPEGDFSDEEVRGAVESGWKAVDLGPLVLRSETAAIAGLAVLEHEMRKKATSIQ